MTATIVLTTTSCQVQYKYAWLASDSTSISRHVHIRRKAAPTFTTGKGKTHSERSRAVVVHPFLQSLAFVVVEVVEPLVCWILLFYIIIFAEWNAILCTLALKLLSHIK